MADFILLNFVDDMPTDSGTDWQFYSGTDMPFFVYRGPSRAVTNHVQGIAGNGKLLQFTPPGPNTTWTMNYAAPSFHCVNVSETHRSKIEDSLMEVAEEELRDHVENVSIPYHLCIDIAISLGPQITRPTDTITPIITAFQVPSGIVRCLPNLHQFRLSSNRSFSAEITTVRAVSEGPPGGRTSGIIRVTIIGIPTCCS